jgi:hypothetical protein
MTDRCKIVVLVDVHLLLLQRDARDFVSFPDQVLQRLLKLQEVHSVGVLPLKENENHAILLIYFAGTLCVLSDIREVLLIIH